MNNLLIDLDALDQDDLRELLRDRRLVRHLRGNEIDVLTTMAEAAASRLAASKVDLYRVTIIAATVKAIADRTDCDGTVNAAMVGAMMADLADDLRAAVAAGDWRKIARLVGWQLIDTMAAFL